MYTALLNVHAVCTATWKTISLLIILLCAHDPTAEDTRVIPQLGGTVHLMTNADPTCTIPPN